MTLPKIGSVGAEPQRDPRRPIQPPSLREVDFRRKRKDGGSFVLSTWGAINSLSHGFTAPAPSEREPNTRRRLMVEADPISVWNDPIFPPLPYSITYINQKEKPLITKKGAEKEK